MFLFIGMQRRCPSIGQLNSVGHFFKEIPQQTITEKFVNLILGNGNNRTLFRTRTSNHHIKLGVVVPRVNDNGSFS